MQSEQPGGDLAQNRYDNKREYGRMDAEGRENRVLAGDGRFNGVIAKDITLRNAKICMGDMELCGIAHECGNGVTLREGLFDELAASPAGGTKDEEFHEAGVSGADSTLMGDRVFQVAF